MQNENTASSQTLRPRFRRIFRRFHFSADQQFLIKPLRLGRTGEQR